MAQLKGPFVTGQEKVSESMKAFSKEMRLGVSRGIRLAGLALQAESQNLVPVEFGNLKASAFTRASETPTTTVVTVGYTAAYALFVHEKVEMVLQGQERKPAPPHIGRYWDPQGQAQPKFLEAPFRQFQPKAIQFVDNEIRKLLS